MRLKAEEFISGHYYHLYNRCVSGRKLFLDEQDYHKFLLLIKKYVKSNEALIIAYCLMPNHYHLLVYQVSERPVFLSLNRISQSYVRYYNDKYRQKGSLWGNKLQHAHIKDDVYLARLCVYIHLNPLKADMVKDIRDWPWSNYLEWVALRDGQLFDHQVRDVYFKKPEQYSDFIMSLTADKSDERNLLDL